MRSAQSKAAKTKTEKVHSSKTELETRGTGKSETPEGELRLPGVSSPQVTLVKRLFAAFRRGDIAFILQNVHPDLSFNVMGKNGIPYSGEYNASNLAVFFEELDDIYQLSEFSAEKFFEQENDLVVTGYLNGKSRPTGKPIESKWVMTFKFKDGKPVLFQDYYDTLNAYKALF